MNRRPIFLERRSYRRQRATDAARLLPVLGLLLFLLPLLWTAHRPLGTAAAGLYLFGAWALLIAGAFAYARLHRNGAPPADEDGPGR